MLLAFLGAIVALAIYGPFFWVRIVMWMHSREISDMPGTGGELARHLIERFELTGVIVEKGEFGKDHYNASTKVVSLSPGNHDGKSITAVAVAAHEVGHAIQFCRDEPISHLRKGYLAKAFTIRRIGSIVIAILMLVTFVLRAPSLLFVTAAVGIITMIASALMYVAILPEEYDASFVKALPILEEGYIPNEHFGAARQVLRAAALTYVAGAVADILNLWRWIRVII